MSGKSIVVVGGGIGGVSAALNLLHAGFDVHVYEQSRALREVGAGINVTPNAARVIHGLGLGDKLASLGVVPMALHQQNWDNGRTLLRTPLGTEIERYFGFPQYQSHRADVLDMLVGALGTRPLLTGSVPVTKTIGIVVVAALTASAAAPFTTITATWRCIKSATRAGIWWRRPTRRSSSPRTLSGSARWRSRWSRTPASSRSEGASAIAG